MLTYEKLVARIAKLSITPKTNVVPSELATALMAVIELHYEDVGTPIDDPISVCDWCKLAYPCPTIQAIEKELK